MSERKHELKRELKSESKSSPISKILGKRFVNDEGSKKLLPHDSNLYLVYFTASWCGPCKEFTPKLDKFVKDCHNAGKSVTVIVAPYKDAGSSFTKYFKKLPFELAFPTDSKTQAGLESKYEVNSVPNLLVFKDDGKQTKFDGNIKEARKLISSGDKSSSEIYKIFKD